MNKTRRRERYAMLNYSNLSDIEFEELCKDIMSKKLNVQLRSFSRGRDGGIDLCEDTVKKTIVVQVKHYINSLQDQVVSALRKEVTKVKKLHPVEYYVCCSRELSLNNINRIYEMFKDYMSSSENIITIKEIDDFLNRENNKDILEKHYKLWIESSGILQNIINKNLFIDCEALLSDAENDQKRFVQTRAYYDAKNKLENNRAVLIVGNPGVGKTITSEMIVLFYATKGYRVRFTTSTDNLNDLKRALSLDKDAKEIILIDDCFGQAYFDMKASQNKELISLVKHVNLSNSKKLLLNSRVTIFHEARRRGYEFEKLLDDNGCNVCILDMDEMPEIDKARILYNHLFSGVEADYFNEIRKNQRYFSIIRHKNYNPRIIEYVCNRRFTGLCKAEEYYNLFINKLDNPQEVWRNEYENNLDRIDRILLSTIYSFSDKETNYYAVKEAFETRLMSEEGIDTTQNHFMASVERLTNGLIVIVDKAGNRFLSVANPSINDFLDNYIQKNVGERNTIIKKALFIEQLVRMMSSDEFDAYINNAIINHNITHYHSLDTFSLNALIVYYIGKGTILDHTYDGVIYDYIIEPDEVQLSRNKQIPERAIVVSLLNNEDVVDYYRLAETINIETVFSEMATYISFEDLVSLIQELSKGFGTVKRKEFIDASENALKKGIELYCSVIDAFDYDPDIDYCLKCSVCLSDSGEYLDETRAIEKVEREVMEAVLAEIDLELSDLPLDIIIDDDFISGIDINIKGAEQIIESYMDQSDYIDYFEDPIIDNEKEIRIMFER